jgi:hypothetical protein
MFRVAVCPGFKVSGNAPPVEENPAPLTVMPLMVTAAVPEDVTVSNCDTAVLTVVLPKLMVEELTVRKATAAEFS